MKNAFSVVLLLLLMLSSCGEDEIPQTPLEGSWKLVSLEAVGTRIVNQRGSVRTDNARWEADSQDYQLTFSGFSLETDGSYTLQMTGVKSGKEYDEPQTYTVDAALQSFDLVEKKLTLDRALFELELVNLDMDQGLLPVEVTYTLDGDELVLRRSQSKTSTTGLGITLSETVNMSSIWQRQ